jgi:hypothetical protein
MSTSVFSVTPSDAALDAIIASDGAAVSASGSLADELGHLVTIVGAERDSGALPSHSLASIGAAAAGSAATPGVPAASAADARARATAMARIIAAWLDRQGQTPPTPAEMPFVVQIIEANGDAPAIVPPGMADCLSKVQGAIAALRSSGQLPPPSRHLTAPRRTAATSAPTPAPAPAPAPAAAPALTLAVAPRSVGVPASALVAAPVLQAMASLPDAAAAVASSASGSSASALGGVSGVLPASTAPGAQIAARREAFQRLVLRSSHIAMTAADTTSADPAFGDSVVGVAEAVLDELGPVLEIADRSTLPGVLAADEVFASVRDALMSAPMPAGVESGAENPVWSLAEALATVFAPSKTAVGTADGPRKIPRLAEHMLAGHIQCAVVCRQSITMFKYLHETMLGRSARDALSAQTISGTENLFTLLSGAVGGIARYNLAADAGSGAANALALDVSVQRLFAAFPTVQPDVQAQLVESVLRAYKASHKQLEQRYLTSIAIFDMTIALMSARHEHATREHEAATAAAAAAAGAAPTRARAAPVARDEFQAAASRFRSLAVSLYGMGRSISLRASRVPNNYGGYTSVNITTYAGAAVLRAAVAMALAASGACSVPMLEALHEFAVTPTRAGLAAAETAIKLVCLAVLPAPVAAKPAALAASAGTAVQTKPPAAKQRFSSGPHALYKPVVMLARSIIGTGAVGCITGVLGDMAIVENSSAMVLAASELLQVPVILATNGTVFPPQAVRDSDENRIKRAQAQAAAAAAAGTAPGPPAPADDGTGLAVMTDAQREADLAAGRLTAVASVAMGIQRALVVAAAVGSGTLKNAGDLAPGAVSLAMAAGGLSASRDVGARVLGAASEAHPAIEPASGDAPIASWWRVLDGAIKAVEGAGIKLESALKQALDASASLVTSSALVGASSGVAAAAPSARAVAARKVALTHWVAAVATLATVEGIDATSEVFQERADWAAAEPTTADGEPELIGAEEEEEAEAEAGSGEAVQDAGADAASAAGAGTSATADDEELEPGQEPAAEPASGGASAEGSGHGKAGAAGTQQAKEEEEQVAAAWSDWPRYSAEADNGLTTEDEEQEHDEDDDIDDDGEQDEAALAAQEAAAAEAQDTTVDEEERKMTVLAAKRALLRCSALQNAARSQLLVLGLLRSNGGVRLRARGRAPMKAFEVRHLLQVEGALTTATADAVAMLEAVALVQGDVQLDDDVAKPDATEAVTFYTVPGKRPEASLFIHEVVDPAAQLAAADDGTGSGSGGPSIARVEQELLDVAEQIARFRADRGTLVAALQAAGVAPGDIAAEPQDPNAAPPAVPPAVVPAIVPSTGVGSAGSDDGSQSPTVTAGGASAANDGDAASAGGDAAGGDAAGGDAAGGDAAGGDAAGGDAAGGDAGSAGGDASASVTAAGVGAPPPTSGSATAPDADADDGDDAESEDDDDGNSVGSGGSFGSGGSGGGFGSVGGRTPADLQSELSALDGSLTMSFTRLQAYTRMRASIMAGSNPFSAGPAGGSASARGAAAATSPIDADTWPLCLNHVLMTSVELLRLLQGLKEHVRVPSHSVTMPAPTSGWWEVITDGRRHDRRAHPYGAVELWLDEKIRDIAQALTVVPSKSLPERLQRVFRSLRVARHAASKPKGPDLNFRIDTSGAGGRQVRGGNMLYDEDEDEDFDIIATHQRRQARRQGIAFRDINGPQDGGAGESARRGMMQDDMQEMDLDNDDTAVTTSAGRLDLAGLGLGGGIANAMGGAGNGGVSNGTIDISSLMQQNAHGDAAPGAGGGAVPPPSAQPMPGMSTAEMERFRGGDGQLQIQKQDARPTEDDDEDRPSGAMESHTVNALLSAEDKKRLMGSTSKSKMLEDFMRKIKGQAGEAAVSMRPDVEWERIGLRPDVKLSKTSYALLTRLPAFLRIRNELMAELRARMMKMAPSGQRRVFEFCMLVDNSGSMDGEIGKQVRISLTLLMEVFRRLEVDFSVILFGKSQKRLKQLDEPLDALRGQAIIESLTFDEGTQLRSAVKAAMSLGFQRRKALSSSAIVARSIIILSDGFVETAGDEGTKYAQMLTAGAESLGGKLNMCFLGLLEKFAIPKKAEILEGMNFLTGGTTGKAKDNQSITLIEPGKAREMVPKVCSLVGRQFELMMRDAAAVEKATKAADKSSKGAVSSAGASASGADGKDEAISTSGEFVAPLVAGRRDAAIIPELVARRAAAGAGVAAASASASGAASGAGGGISASMLDDEEEAAEADAAAAAAEGRAPPGLRVPAQVLIRDDPASGVSAPRASDYSRPGEGIPKLEALTKKGVVLQPIEYTTAALTRMRTDVVNEFDRLSRLSTSSVDEAVESELVKAAAAELTLFEARDAGSGGARLVQQLADTMSDSVLPINKYTRRKPDVRGSSLSMRGLIRFLLTNGSYKKIYQRPLAGPKREYKICVAIDRSASMMGGSASMTAYTAIAFLVALRRAGLDSNTIILGFGDSIELIKPDGIPLDGRAAYRLLQACQPKQSFAESASFDADAVAVGSSLLAGASARGPSKLFLFTDGYTSRPSRLPFTLQAAADAGVDVVAIGVGTGTTGSALPSAFQNWVVVDQPNILPSALTSWMAANGGGGGGDASAGGAATDRQAQSAETAFMVEAAAAMRSGDADTSMESVFTGKAGMLTGLISDLESETQLTVQSGRGSSESGSGTMELDMVFVMDLTSSMTSWVATARDHVSKIVTSVKDKIAEMGRSMRFRYGFVGFHDYEGSGSSFREVPEQIKVYPLSEDHESLHSQIASISTGYGGDCEDMIGGLQAALDMHTKQGTGSLPCVGWSDRAAKFIIVIGDVPCHGRNWHSGSDSYRDGDPAGINPEDQLEEMKKRQIRLMVTVIEGGHMASDLETMCERFARIYDENDFGGEMVTLRTRDAHDGQRFTEAVSGAMQQTLIADFL